MAADKTKHFLEIIFFMTLGILPFLLRLKSDFFFGLSMILLYGSLSMAWNIHALSGRISLGHGGFFGLGAYGVVICLHYLKLTLGPAIAVGSLLPIGYALLWNICFDRFTRATFALATFASVEIPRAVIENTEYFSPRVMRIIGSPERIDLSLPSTIQNWYICLLLFSALVLFIHHLAIKSRWGWALRAVRENELTAAAVGINTRMIKGAALLTSAFLAGLCGIFYIHIVGFLDPSIVFGLHFSAIPLVTSFFGGRLHSWGPIVGATVLYGFDQLVIAPLFPSGHAAIYGIVILLTLWLLPEGLLSWFQKQKNT